MGGQEERGEGTGDQLRDVEFHLGDARHLGRDLGQVIHLPGFDFLFLEVVGSGATSFEVPFIVTSSVSKYVAGPQQSRGKNEKTGKSRPTS